VTEDSNHLKMKAPLITGTRRRRDLESLKEERGCGCNSQTKPNLSERRDPRGDGPILDQRRKGRIFEGKPGWIFREVKRKR